MSASARTTPDRNANAGGSVAMNGAAASSPGSECGGGGFPCGREPPRLGPDGLPRLNARQRRTLRRAKERAIKGLMEAGHLLLQRQHQGGGGAGGADGEQQETQQQQEPDGDMVAVTATVTAAAAPRTPERPSGKAKAGAAASSEDEDCSPSPAAPGGSLKMGGGGGCSPGSADGGSGVDDVDEQETERYISAALSVAGGSHGPKAAAAAAAALSKVAADLRDIDISDVIAQLALRRCEGVVDDKLLRDLAIIQNLLGALRIPLPSSQQRADAAV